MAYQLPGGQVLNDVDAGPLMRLHPCEQSVA